VRGVAPSIAEACENESLRVGASANLPDCRSYEMVTPVDKSSASEDLDTGGTEEIASADGNRVALQSYTTFGPRPQIIGSLSVFSRTPEGWTIESVPPPGAGDAIYTPELFSPDLTDVGVRSETLGSPLLTLAVGVPGNFPISFPPVPREPESGGHPYGSSVLLGASPDFSHVILASTDHTLLSSTPTGTDEHAYDLYELAEGGLQLVNVSNERSVIGQCGATLGNGVEDVESLGNTTPQPDMARNAVSADGSRVFFTSPDPSGEGAGCPVQFAPSMKKLELDPPRLYMRVTEVRGDVEEGHTVEVSAPQGVSHSVVEEEEEDKMPVLYSGASVDGSKVFFQTERALTGGAAIDHPHLYEYDTQAPEGERLKLIFQGGLHEDSEVNLETETEEVFVSADGSVVYFYRGGFRTLYSYEAADGGSVQQIATMEPPKQDEPPQATPDGEFFLFASEGVMGEPRGFGHNEIYRYDHATGSVMCVSCGPGTAPPTLVTPSIPDEAEGAFTGAGFYTNSGGAGQLRFPDLTPETRLISNDGSEVFFESNAVLLPRVVDEGVLNVYEWEVQGSGGCAQSGGCTYLISQGDSAKHSLLIGASEDGSNVFFMTHAQLVPQDIDSSFNIYDARENGGFPPPGEPAACLGDTCLNAPVAPVAPLLATAGVLPGNPVPQPVVGSPPPKPKSKPAKCRKGKVRKKGRCVPKAKARRRAHRARRGVSGGAR
jgi:hypothetical protein